MAYLGFLLFTFFWVVLNFQCRVYLWFYVNKLCLCGLTKASSLRLLIASSRKPEGRAAAKRRREHGEKREIV